MKSIIKKSLSVFLSTIMLILSINMFGYAFDFGGDSEKEKIFNTIPNIDYMSIDEIRKYDPQYPSINENKAYWLSVPTLKDRLTISEDGKTGMLFAPYITKSAGWSDANKNWVNDGRLCWAAACSNTIRWYLDTCEITGANDVTGKERNLYNIFDKFRNNWEPLEGYDYAHGLSWYFTGHTMDGTTPPNLRNPNSGGYLNNFKHAYDAWGVIDPVNDYSAKGNYQDKFPFIDIADNVYFEGGSLYNHKNFSNTIITQLHYGASLLMVGQQNASAGSAHAVTLWGCEYNVENGLVTKLYITDSDDECQTPGAYLREVGVKANNPDSGGVKLTHYQYTEFPIVRLIDSTVLYAAGVVHKWDEEQPEPHPQINYGDANGDGIMDIDDYYSITNFVNGQIDDSKIDVKSADFNHDGAVDGFDAIAISIEINNK